MAGKFKKGDTVVLKSGGPEMTVTGEGRNRENSVTWFNDKNEQQYSEFDDDVLDAADDE